MQALKLSSSQALKLSSSQERSEPQRVGCGEWPVGFGDM